MKAIVLEAKHANTLVLECGAVWLKPGTNLVVEESLGQLVAAKYALEILGACESDKKWKIVRSDLAGKVDVSGSVGSSLEDVQANRDMGSDAGKKKVRKKATKKA